MAKVFRFVPQKFLNTMLNRIKPLKLKRSNEVAGTKAKFMSFQVTTFSIPEKNESLNKGIEYS